MRHTLKFFLICTILSLSLIFFSSAAIAQCLWDFPEWCYQEVHQEEEKGIIVDDFEWGNGYGWSYRASNGWVLIEPEYIGSFFQCYPTWCCGCQPIMPSLGYVITYTDCSLSWQENYRCLAVYNGIVYNKIKLFRDISTPAPSDSDPVLDYIDLYEYPVLSFKLKEPFPGKPENMFEFDVIGFSDANHDVVVKVISPNNTTYDTTTSIVTAFSQQSLEVEVSVGNNYLDSQDLLWHTCRINIYEAVKEAVDNFDGIAEKSDWYMTKADSIRVSGSIFYLDDIIFRPDEDDEDMCEPYLFKIGPRYAQIFEPYRYLFVAEDCASDGTINVMDLLLIDANDRLPDDELYNPAALNNIFETDPNVIKAYWLAQGADPNSFDPNHPSYLTPDSGISAAMGRDFVIYPSASIFAREDFRFNASGTLGDPNNPKYPNPAFVDMTGTSGINQTLQWNATVGSLGANGVQFEKLAPLAINPLDGMPTYIPAYGNAGDVAAIYGKPFWGPDVVTLLEGALYNAGFIFWPNIAFLDFTPQIFEDIILTIEVTNGRTFDYEMLQISVVNYPFENYPPNIEDVFDQTAYVGERYEYQMTAIDTDCFIFSLSQSEGEDPSYSHLPMLPGNQIRDDMDNLRYYFYIYVNGILIHRPIPAYCGPSPWLGGLLSYTPQYIYDYYVEVDCVDNYGSVGFADFTINCTYPPGNHPPIIIKSPEDPIIAWAGQEVVVSAPDIEVMDPDGDTLYASCNIGSVCQNADHGFMNWSFMTHYPGLYNVEIIFSDRKGGYATMEFQVDVRPWWSYE